MAKQQSRWETKLLDEVRIGFVEEHGSKASAAERAEAFKQEHDPKPVPAPVKQHDPLSKILNEARIGFDAIRRPFNKSES